MPIARAALRLLTMVGALLLLAPAPAPAQQADPGAAWSSADSANFRIHYRAGQRAAAERVAAVAERVYPRITQALQWQPQARTEIALFAESDLANGFATPLPFNRLGLVLAPPDVGELLDNSAWLDLVLAHELTHVVHLDRVRGAPQVLRRIFGRLLWVLPNVFQPAWLIEGVAVLAESEPAAGRGRLRSPWFEAWLRAERAAGFPTLAEMNADGRRLPLARPYLYGAYFFEFLERRYGRDSSAALIERYSGNVVPRLHSAPWAATGKTMDALWQEFVADLTAQVDARAAPIVREPEAVGEPLLASAFEIGDVAALPDGALLALVDDGLAAPALLRIERGGAPTRLLALPRGARLGTGAGGRVLVARPELCRNRYLAYDLHELQDPRQGHLVPWSECAHLRRGVPVAEGVAALQLDGSRTRLVTLAAPLAAPALRYEAPPDTDLIDLAAAPDGRRVAVIAKREGDWRVLEFDLGAPGAAPRTLLAHGAPLSSLRWGAAGLEMVASVDGQLNVWRLAAGRLERLTHSHTAVVAQAGTASDGTLASVVIAPRGYRLHRLAAPKGLQTRAVPAAGPAAPAAAAAGGAAAADGALGAERPYSAWPSLLPRSWFPLVLADRGLTALGASTFGADALGWHEYTASLLAETSERELLGSFAYTWRGQHMLSLERSLAVRSTRGSGSDEQVTAYERNSTLQALTLLPWLKLERRLRLGLGVAAERTELIDAERGRRVDRRDERLVAVLADLDTRGANWFSEGPNRGLRASLLVESYRPFTQSSGYDGDVLRADLRAHLATPPRSAGVLALRWTEVRARGRTEPFQLGGATETHLRPGCALGERDLALRGYRGDEPALRGRHARVASLEWRSALADIDRHAMVPPVGINRLSLAAFFDIGGAWSSGSGPDRWRRGAGVELLGDVQLLYALGLQLRAGVARGLDAPKGTRAYLTLGRSF
jgi:hypothetical protein